MDSSSSGVGDIAAGMCLQNLCFALISALRAPGLSRVVFEDLKTTEKSTWFWALELNMVELGKTGGGLGWCAFGW
ncbi:hypothetical protein Tco_1501264 [Tanacetum coccineum]